MLHNLYIIVFQSIGITIFGELPHFEAVLVVILSHHTAVF